MTALEDYINDWKKVKGNDPLIDEKFLKQKNNTIMENLKKFEKKEKQEIYAGLAAASTSVFLIVAVVVGMPIAKGLISFNLYLLVGFLLMILSLVFFAKILLNNTIKFNESSATKLFLQDAKQKLTYKKSNAKKAAFTYAILLILGLNLLLFGITNMFLTISFAISIAAFLFAFFIWNRKFKNEKQPKIDKLILEIDDLILAFK